MDTVSPPHLLQWVQCSCKAKGRTSFVSVENIAHVKEQNGIDD